MSINIPDALSQMHLLPIARTDQKCPSTHTLLFITTCVQVVHALVSGILYGTRYVLAYGAQIARY